MINHIINSVKRRGRYSIYNVSKSYDLKYGIPVFDTINKDVLKKNIINDINNEVSLGKIWSNQLTPIIDELWVDYRASPVLFSTVPPMNKERDRHIFYNFYIDEDDELVCNSFYNASHIYNYPTNVFTDALIAHMIAAETDLKPKTLNINYPCLYTYSKFSIDNNYEYKKVIFSGNSNNLKIDADEIDIE